jgi:hypothetical protein
MLREDGKSQSSNGWDAIVTQEPLENRSSILEIRVRRNGSDRAGADDGI